MFFAASLSPERISINACFLSPLPSCLWRENQRLSADFGGAPFVPLLNFLLSIEPHSLLRDALVRGKQFNMGLPKI